MLYTNVQLYATGIYLWFHVRLIEKAHAWGIVHTNTTHTTSEIAECYRFPKYITYFHTWKKKSPD